MLLFAGLGNPGAKYANNRHNVGFMAADAIARRHSFSPWSKKFQAEIAEGKIGGDKVVLIKPQTFMNLSGQSVGEALRFYKLEPSDVTVFYDEIELPAGKVRVKTGGGSAGHNGIRSLDQHIGKNYRRVRISGLPEKPNPAPVDPSVVLLPDGRYRLVGVSPDGERSAIVTVEVVNGHGTAGGALEGAFGDVSEVRLLGERGREVADAELGGS